MTKLKVIKQEQLNDWAKEIFQKNSFSMVDVSSKKQTFRRALATGKIFVGKKVLNLIKNKKMPKGNPVALAEVSAVLGVKKTTELIPLCHPLPIDHIATKVFLNEVDFSLEVYCVVSAVAKTGVEMEAIMGVNAALITIYDLSKIVNPHLKIDNVKLLIKEGGKSGLWTNPDGLPKYFLIMKVKLELFGASRDLSNKNFLEFNIEEKISIKDFKKKIINYVDKNFKGNEYYKKIIEKSAFCSEDNNIIPENYKIIKDQKIGIIPPIGGG